MLRLWNTKTSVSLSGMLVDKTKFVLSGDIVFFYLPRLALLISFRLPEHPRNYIRS